VRKGILDIRAARGNHSAIQESTSPRHALDLGSPSRPHLNEQEDRMRTTSTDGHELAGHSKAPSFPIARLDLEEEIRQMRAGTPDASVVSRNVMNGNASRLTSSRGATRATTPRACGPTTAMVAHCSVPEVQ